ncbi:hypothetical protein N7450_007327 [Penicillium hetheringtonii]|uniref:Uncharacterized protein n=1 Tax=Penicillium hetheringtonii TaxID=911720 RepID=A0AAD6DHG8_9EURO|nr:hypothetical protein N7450_007327 [Penicillium hetheringtonii]
MQDYIDQYKEGNLLDLPRMRSLAPPDLSKLKQTHPGRTPGPEGDLVEFVTEERIPAMLSISEMWDPGDLRDYFSSDVLGILPRVAKATYTELSVVAGLNLLQISVTGRKREDVDEALDKLHTSLGFVVLIQEPLHDLVVLPSRDETGEYHLGKLMDIDRVSGCVVEDCQKLKFPLEKAMIPYSLASKVRERIQKASPPPTTDASVPAYGSSLSVQSAPLAWSQSDFPDLSNMSPLRRPIQVKSPSWPSLSTANSPTRWPHPPGKLMSDQDDTSRVVAAPTFPSPPLKPPLHEITKSEHKTQVNHLREVTVPHPRLPELVKLGASRLAFGTKIRKPASQIEDKPASKMGSPGMPEFMAIQTTHQKDCSTTPLSTTSSSQSCPSESSHPLSQSPPCHATPPSSSTSSPPSLRRASRPGSPEFIPSTKRPKYSPGNREKLASVRFPSYQSLGTKSTLPNTSTSDVRGTEKELQDRLVLPGTISQPSSSADSLAVSEPSKLIGSASLERPSCVPKIFYRMKPPVPPKPQGISGHAVGKAKPLRSEATPCTEASKLPRVMTKPASPSDLSKELVRSQTLIDLDPVDEAPRSASPVLHSDLTGLQIGDQIGILSLENFTHVQPDLDREMSQDRLDTNPSVQTSSSRNTAVALVNQVVVPKVSEIPGLAVITDTISAAEPNSQGQLLDISDNAQGNASPSPEEPPTEEDGQLPLVYIIDGMPIIPCIEVLMSAPQEKIL